MDSCKDSSTPMATNCYLDVDKVRKHIDQTKCRDMIDSLLYLTISCLDIMHNVCAMFQSCPKESHLTIVKRILKYLKAIKTLDLWYPRGANISLVGYNDLDFRGYKTNRKDINETCHLLGCYLLS